MKNKGFSLIELLLVLSLIAVLIGYGFKSYRHSTVIIEAEIDRQYILKIPVLLEEIYATTLNYPNQLDGIINSINNHFYTPKAYYRLLYRRKSNNQYQLSAQLNLEKSGSNYINCSLISLDETGKLSGFDQSGNPLTNDCWR